MSRRSRGHVLLTRRALDDLAEIHAYSTSEWGHKSAEKYLNDLEAGLERVRQSPDLVEFSPDLHPALGFYRVRKHLYACDVQGDSIVVLTVMHASMDIPRRLSELEPTLAAEVELLHQTLRGAGRRKT